MKFDKPATTNPIDQLKVVGQPIDRIDGPLKTTGTAPYAHDRHDVIANQAHGYILGAGIAHGRIRSLDLTAAKAAPGVLAIVTHENAGKLGKGNFNVAKLLGGPQIDHYHQAVAVVVAETFEQARAATALIRIDYASAAGVYDLEAAKDSAEPADGTGVAGASAVGNFDEAFAAAPVSVDAMYSTAHESHSMMEPHATIAAWDGDQLTLWTSNQMINWTRGDVAKTFGMPPAKVRVISPYVGGGFGAKLFLRADSVMAALGARAARRPVRIALQRALVPNNTVHRSVTLQRIRIGASRDGKITAIGHQAWSANLPGGKPEASAIPVRSLYAGEHRMTSNMLAMLNLPESNAMRAPGEASGLAAFEIAMDELAEKLGLDPVELRIRNDTQVVPDQPAKPGAAAGAKANSQPPFSQRQFIECFRVGAEKFGWSKRNAKPGQVREGQWLIGHGVAAAMRDSPVMKSAARVRLDHRAHVIVETDMTDIGTGSYTVIAQTAAEMLGVPMEHITVRLGDSDFPVSSGSGGQWGGNSSTAGVYAACVKLRGMIAQRAGLNAETASFAGGKVSVGDQAFSLVDLARKGELVAEDFMEYGTLDKQYQQSTFGAHFVEVAVHAHTFETRVRRMLAVCAAGRILNPKTARSQVIGGMTMGVGAALMEELAVDTRRGFFVNHDLAGYEIPVHADIPHQDVIFLDETDPMSSPMKAKGVAELGICGVAAAVANAVYNATGVRVRDYPVTLDKLLMQS